jgi:UDP-N-acetylglucosamine 1-carboxyvinyltransferase
MTLGNVPQLRDIATTMGLLGCMGGHLTVDERMRIRVDTSTIKHFSTPYELVRTMRVNLLTAG